MLAVAAHAQTRADRAIDEVVVTGSRLPATLADSASPIAVIRADDLARAGYTATADIIRLLPANAGSEFNLDPFTQNLSAGTSNFNLRGLGLNATLVLLNGRRQTVSGGIADDGSAFVDLNALVPAIALERAEVLKDGAAALYGTDAIAGVANFITRRDMRGVEAQIDYAGSARSGQDDMSGAALAGGATEKLSGLAAVSYMRRSWLPSTDRDYTAGKAFSSFGQPGAFILLAPSPAFPTLPAGLARNVPIIDPDCGPAGGAPNPSVTQPPGLAGFRAGTCTFDFAPYYHLVPRERRWNLFGSGELLAADRITLFAEAGYARQRVVRGTSPSFPILNLPTVPADNPGNVFRTPVLFLGRALGAARGAGLVRNASDTWRGVAGARGTGGPWSWEAALTHSANEFLVEIEDAKTDRFLAALAGRGGPGNNLSFNPFGSAALSRPGQATYNDPAVIADFLGLVTFDYRTRLTTLDAAATRALAAWPSGEVELALGGQLRRDKVIGDLDEDYNRENYLFQIGGPDFAGRRDVWAAFGELRLPVSDAVDLQLALRHENAEGGLSSTDPKIAALWRPADALSMRAAFATSFRAPSVFQAFSVQTVLSDVADPVTGVRGFRGVRTIGNAGLKPERADVANLGATWSPVDVLTLSADYWRFDYRDIIVKEGAQAIVDANPFDPRVVRAAGQIVRVDVGYVNAPSALTDGLDLSGRLAWDDVTGGEWQLTAAATWINRFSIRAAPGGPRVDVAGNRNFRTFARSLPRWRGDTGVAWAHGRHGAAATVRYVGGYRDDQNANARIDAQ
ncbi:MAG: TonB-dependent receptor, partial [Rhodospirillaceae bacterium]|nr:TonB-dependent receptor [Rhodospirillaceae bacterium]